MLDTDATPSGTVDTAGFTARAFVRDEDSEDAIRQSLADLGIKQVKITQGNVDTATQTLAREASPRLLIVDVSGVDDAVASLRDLADVCDPDMHVIAFGEKNDIILYRELKNTGIHEYFLKPVVPDLLTRSCSAILSPGDVAKLRLRSGKLVFVLGARGGAGATTIAANTAWHLAEQRRRSTVAVDLDFHAGDLALSLNAAPTGSLSDALAYPERVDRLFLERGTIYLSERLDLLASLHPLDTEIEAAEEAILSLFDKLLARYRFVVADIPPAIAARSARLMQLSSTCLLVSNASLAAARDVARWRERIGTNTSGRRTLHILNHVSPVGELSDEDFEKASGQVPDAVIPYDRDLAKASNFGIRATQRCPLFQKHLSAVLRPLTGEAAARQVSILKRVFG